jgi:hypothetical protein
MEFGIIGTDCSNHNIQYVERYLLLYQIQDKAWSACRRDILHCCVNHLFLGRQYSEMSQVLRIGCGCGYSSSSSNSSNVVPVTITIKFLIAIVIKKIRYKVLQNTSSMGSL